MKKTTLQFVRGWTVLGCETSNERLIVLKKIKQKPTLNVQHLLDEVEEREDINKWHEEESILGIL